MLDFACFIGALGLFGLAALYARAGFSEAGRRRGYYARTDGSREDALVLALNFSR